MMVEKGKAYSLKDVIERFLSFGQRTDGRVQPWELIDDRLSSFYGATLRVPMYDRESTDLPYNYYIVGNELLKSHSGTTNFKDHISSTYQKAKFIEYYGCSSLDDVKTYIEDNILSFSTGNNIPNKIIFNCAEEDISSGESPRTVLDKIIEIENLCNSYEIDYNFFLTPTPSAISSGDNFNILARCSKFSHKPVIVCLGDSLTDKNTLGNWSWVDEFQRLNPDVTMINKGMGGHKVIDAINRFDRDVIQQLPDMCIIWIGGNDMWNGSASYLDTVKQNYKKLVDDCISYGIVPVLVLYELSMQQIHDISNGDPLYDPKIGYNSLLELYNYCKNLAKSYNIDYIRVYDELKVAGEIPSNYLMPDNTHWSVDGANAVAYYISNKLNNYVSKLVQEKLATTRSINVYKIFCDNLNVSSLSSSDISGLMCSDGNHYTQQAQDYVISYISDDKYVLPTAVPYFYVSMQHTRVNSNTYVEWLRQSIDDVYYQCENYNRNNASGENIFKNTGDFVAVGLHTLFDRGLWMCEQGGITCAKEATNQINEGINLRKAKVVTVLSVSPYRDSVSLRAIPVFPGTGCPWFTLGDDNKTKFNVASLGIDYWFTKNDYDATITIKVNGDIHDVYQSMSFGMMETTDDSYLFPLYIAGGSQGLREDFFTWEQNYGSSSKPDYRTMQSGSMNSYDLDIENPALSNSNLLSPTKFNGSNMSNFRVLSPEGIWRDIFGYEQSAPTKNLPSCDPKISSFAIILDAPKELDFESEHSAYPFFCVSNNRIDTYTVNEKWSEGKHSSPFEKVVVFFNSKIDNKENGFQGVLPNVYDSWFKNLPVGEITIGGKKFLSVPNGWENRLWYYPTSFGEQSSSNWGSKAVRDKYDELFSKLGNGIMHQRLLIPLEGDD